MKRDLLVDLFNVGRRDMAQPIDPLSADDGETSDELRPPEFTADR